LKHKSCTRKDPSGARFGAQKVARKKTNLKHDLEHKKLHAKKTHLEHDLKHKKLNAKRTDLEHDLKHKKLEKTWQETLFLQNKVVYCAVLREI